jgi:hypothetical protein
MLPLPIERKKKNHCIRKKEKNHINKKKPGSKKYRINTV